MKECYNELYEVSKIEYTHKDVEKRMHRLRIVVLILMLNIEIFQDYIQQYEKGFLLEQLIRFRNMYELEIEAVNIKNKEHRESNELKELESVNELSMQAMNATWNLKYVYERFARFDDSYKKTLYQQHVNITYNKIYAKHEEKDQGNR